MERALTETKFVIPREVAEVVGKLESAGFEAYVVGGCVRDLLLGRTPDDWDVTTNATPEQIRDIFPESFYENKFFTVTVKTGADEPTLREIEVTTFRSEGRYRDKRHPEEVKPAKTLEEDLARRDFTINAIALGMKSAAGGEPRQGRETLNPKSETISKSQISKNKRVWNLGNSNLYLIDPPNGQKDLEQKLVRAVGNAEERFKEDALRMLRAVRLATQLGFSIEEKTKTAIQKNAGWLQAISKERIRDEFSKILMAPRPAAGAPLAKDDVRAGGPGAKPEKPFATITDAPGTPAARRLEAVADIGAARAWQGIELLEELGLLKYIVPELEEGIGCTQNKHHVYTVWEHNLRSLDYAVKHGFGLAVRLGALFHDIAKPRAKRGEGPDSTFYGHDVLGAKMAYQILSRLRYPEVFTGRVAKLVRWHLFRYDYEVDEVQTTDSAIRRLIRNVGEENITDLVKVRMCDRIGSGVPKAVPYRLRHFQYRVEKVLREHEAVKVTMLQIRGDDVMRILDTKPGPKVGHVLNALLEEVLDDPAKNRKEYLEARIGELGKFSDEELVKLREQTEARVELLEDQREEEIKKKYYVK